MLTETKELRQQVEAELKLPDPKPEQAVAALASATLAEGNDDENGKGDRKIRRASRDGSR